MRLLHLVWTFSELTETFIYDAVVETAASAEAAVVTMRRANRAERPFDRVFEIGPRGWLARLRDRLVAPWSRLPTPDRAWSSLRRGLASAAREVRPDVIHAHFGDMGVLAAPLAAKLRVPLVTSFYGYDASRQIAEPPWQAWFRVLTTGRNHVVVLADAMRPPLVAAGLDPARISTFPTGKRLDAYRFRQRNTPPTRLVTVGRLVEKKGHADAIAAVARLAAEGHALELEIIGEGPLEQAVRSQISALGLADRVRLTGPLPHADARARMEAADAFILCSRTAPDGDREGLPTVLLEAQALGLPCVSTRHAGIPEAIPAENHWLLAAEGDVEGIAGALRSLREASPDRIAEVSSRGLAHVRARHDVARQGDALLALYRRLAGG